jgi:hypothetical protein
MAKARKATRKRRSSRVKHGAALTAKVNAALAPLKKDFKVAKIVGSAKGGKLDLKSVTRNMEIRFIALNAPFKTTALTSAP